MSDLYTTNDISKMDFKALKRKVQELEDTIAKMKRMYEDAIYNLDSSNFSSSWVREQDNMKAQIKLSAEELSSVYTRVDDNRTALETQIRQNAEAISLKASKTELDEWGNNLEEQIASITVTADEIEIAVKNEVSNQIKNASITVSSEEILSTVVSKCSNDYFDYFDDNWQIGGMNNIGTTEEQKRMLCKYHWRTSADKEAGISYNTAWVYYNHKSGKWEDIDESDAAFYELDENGNLISVKKTQFKQTATGFELSGDVSINGNLITTGTISADRIETNGLSCTKLYNSNEGVVNSPYLAISQYSSDNNNATEYADFGLFAANAASVENSLNDITCHFGMQYYKSKDIEYDYYHHALKLYANGENVLSFGCNTGNTDYQEHYDYVYAHTYASGIWDFTGAYVILPKDTGELNVNHVYYDSNKPKKILKE